MGTREKAPEINHLLAASAKPAYSLADLDEMGILSRTQAYMENRKGRLVFRKIGRRTVILHDELVQYLQNLPLKATLSEDHQERALRRWAKQKHRLVPAQT